MIYVIGFTAFILGVWVGVTFSNNFTNGWCSRVEKKLDEWKRGQNRPTPGMTPSSIDAELYGQMFGDHGGRVMTPEEREAVVEFMVRASCYNDKENIFHKAWCEYVDKALAALESNYMITRRER